MKCFPAYTAFFPVPFGTPTCERASSLFFSLSFSFSPSDLFLRKSTGDTLRGSEVGDVGGINQEDVLAKQRE